MREIEQNYIPTIYDNLIAVYYFQLTNKVLIQPQYKLLESPYLVGIWKLKNLKS
jgi:hypothetical protein